MPTRLKDLKIKRVALVDEGANPDADIVFAKRRDGTIPTQGEDALTAEEQTLSRRFFSALAKVFGRNPEIADVSKKDAKTFGQMQDKKDYSRIIEQEIWPMVSALCESAKSILMDEERDEGAKEALLNQSVGEFSTAFTASTANWAKGIETGSVSKHLEAMSILRDDLNAALSKVKEKLDTEALAPDDEDVKKEPKSDDDSDSPDTPDNDDDKPNDSDGDKTVRKGDSNMIFDTDKMTDEERATFEDLAKRYSHEEANPAPAPTPAAETDTATADDVWKGISPAIREELEALRKFRQDAEEREIADVAKRYEILGKKPEELTPLLKSLKAAGGTAYDDMISMLDSAKAQVESSGLFTEIGKRGTRPDSGENAWAKVEAAAQEIQKARPSLSRAEAIDAACMEHPELVADYEQSRR